MSQTAQSHTAQSHTAQSHTAQAKTAHVAVGHIPVHVDESTDVHVVTLPERFDVFANIEWNLDRVSENTMLLVDGSNVRFADLQALQSLVDARLELLDAGGDLIIGAPSAELHVTLELTGFGDMVPVISRGVS